MQWTGSETAQMWFTKWALIALCSGVLVFKWSPY